MMSSISFDEGVVVDKGNYTFTVDSALLVELGERLVGKSYIALAELIKNSYDADATSVTLIFDLENDKIKIKDNGHGMTQDEFRKFWMRIGSTHKVNKPESRKLRRKVTGSKGIGRLSVQFLANQMKLNTVSEYNKSTEFIAEIDWNEAIQTQELIETEVDFVKFERTEELKQGTSIELKGLRKDWSKDEIRKLARELWWLQPPFRSENKGLPAESRFEIDFISSGEEIKQVFDEQMNAIMKIWHARIVGKSIKGKTQLSVQYNGEKAKKISYKIEDSAIDKVEFEIRIYKLENRQKYGILVNDARDYLNEFGGVHVYDKGFRLPYYGDAKNDWLKLEHDRARRISNSNLLPESLQISKSMQRLPPILRIFGVVNIDTQKEPELDIMVTRDRFVESKAVTDLVATVRWSIDYYATLEYRKKIEEEQEALEKSIREEEEQIDKEYDVDPEKVFKKVAEKLTTQESDDFNKAITRVKKETKVKIDKVKKTANLMGSLATTGITTLAFYHENSKQSQILNDIIDSVYKIKSEVNDRFIREKLHEIWNDLKSWKDKTDQLSGMYSFYSDAENLENRRRFSAKSTILEIWDQLRAIKRDNELVLNDLNSKMRLPVGTIIEWSSIFQNIFINAFAAMLKVPGNQIKVWSKKNTIILEDQGVGIDLDDVDRLFQPFERGLNLSKEDQKFGYGGMGLGLAIVKNIAENLNCEVTFIKPSKHYSSAFLLRWGS